MMSITGYRRVFSACRCLRGGQAVQFRLGRMCCEKYVRMRLSMQINGINHVRIHAMQCKTLCLLSPHHVSLLTQILPCHTMFWRITEDTLRF